MTRRGMTLVEMLVALTATLLMMTAIAQAFAVFGNSISGSRSVLDLDGRMRSTAWRLRTDLAGATARTLPPLRPDSGEGYFEIIEGPARDDDAANGMAVGAADHDDAILLTTRSTETPFVGRAPSLSRSTIAEQAALFESNLAEVAWFARQTPGTTNPVTYTLYRKQLLVMGYVGADPFYSNPAESDAYNRLRVPLMRSGTTYISAANPWGDYFNLPCDISARLEVSATGTFFYPNTIADLTRREARFMHNPSGVTGTANFPFPFVNHQASAPQTGLMFDSSSQRQGEDVVLTNVIAFDVRVFDPAAPVLITADGSALVPGDPGVGDPTVIKTGSASGAYVDLGHMVSANPLLSGIFRPIAAAKFAGYGQARSRLMGSSTTRRCYDTWSLHYEANGLDEDYEDLNNNGILDPGEDKNANGVLDVTVDQGTDGIDNDNDGLFDEPAYDFDGNGNYTDTEDTNGNGSLEASEDFNGNGVLDRDDLGEAETLPPYPVPLRGIEVRIRCYEPSSRQVRQVTIRHTFVPH